MKNNKPESREEWNLRFPKDEMPDYLGIDGQYIPERYIPYNTSNLITGDSISDKDGQRLYYVKEDKSFKLITNKSNEFLANPFKTWTNARA